MTYDTTNKTDMKTLEDWDEVFCDALEDVGVFDLKLGERVSYGTYQNNFTCTAEDAVMGDEGLRLLTREVNAEFYGMEDPVTIVVKTYVSADGDVCQTEAYWFDAYESDVPSQHPQWATIVENMDILLEDDDLDVNDYDDD